MFYGLPDPVKSPRLWGEQCGLLGNCRVCVPETGRGEPGRRCPTGISAEETMSDSLVCQAFHLTCCCSSLSPCNLLLKIPECFPHWPDILPGALVSTEQKLSESPAATGAGHSAIKLSTPWLLQRLLLPHSVTKSFRLERPPRSSSPALSMIKDTVCWRIFFSQANLYVNAVDPLHLYLFKLKQVIFLQYLTITASSIRTYTAAC